jgi:hypothetical protein
MSEPGMARNGPRSPTGPRKRPLQGLPGPVATIGLARGGCVCYKYCVALLCHRQGL